MNYKVRKVFSIFILTLLILIASTKYYGIRGIDNLAYVVAIGIDVGTDENLLLSLQISLPNTDESSGSSSQSSSVVVESVECSSINTGITLFNSYLGKEINLSHCKVLVISEEFATQGVSEVLYTLTNEIQFRTTSNIIISKCDAKTYLEYSAPLLDKVSARYYEIAPTSSEYTGYTESITCNEFLSAIGSCFSSPVAILGSINSEATQNLSNSGSTTNSTSDSSASSSSSSDSASGTTFYTAGESPISPKQDGVETMGLAVFNKDQLVGELNGFESICHLIISNKLKNAQIRVPSPVKELDFIDLYIEFDDDTKNSVYLVNSTPFITSKIKITAKMQSMNKNINLKDEELVSKIETSAEAFLKENIMNYLYKTSKEFGSDIDSFGLYASKYFSTNQEWENYNWLHHYKDAYFNVDVDVNLRSSYLLISTDGGK